MGLGANSIIARPVPPPSVDGNMDRVFFVRASLKRARSAFSDKSRGAGAE